MSGVRKSIVPDPFKESVNRSKLFIKPRESNPKNSSITSRSSLSHITPQRSITNLKKHSYYRDKQYKDRPSQYSEKQSIYKDRQTMRKMLSSYITRKDTICDISKECFIDYSVKSPATSMYQDYDQDDGSEISDDSFRPSPNMFQRNRRLSNPFYFSAMNTFERKNDVFNAHILNIARMNRLKSKTGTKRVHMSLREANTYIIKKVNVLRHRENIFRATSKLTITEPAFPKWVYQDKRDMGLNMVTFNVGGKVFETFDDTVMNLPHTKLADCLTEHSSGTTVFFDRDPLCFKSVLNFYRTGKLHAPSSTCLSFFESELEYWGINEDLMEPCCYSNYKSNKIASNNLRQYMEYRGKNISDRLGNFRSRMFATTSLKQKTLFGKWYQNLCGVVIITSIFCMVFMTSHVSRDLKLHAHAMTNVTRQDLTIKVNESVVDFYQRTELRDSIRMFDNICLGFFTADIFIRFTFSTNRLIFFSDMLNWMDIFATTSSLIAIMPITYTENFELISFILKVPRLFRLFHLNKNLRCGIDALSMTLLDSTKELKLFVILISACSILFGSLIFVIELIDNKSQTQIQTIFTGVWWAVVTMSTTGYGDIVPHTTGGFVIGILCILVGIIITQLPVPIFLSNFSLYYNQIHARIEQMNVQFEGDLDMDLEPELNIQNPFEKKEKMKKNYMMRFKSVFDNRSETIF